jgi:hypothetical protein
MVLFFCYYMLPFAMLGTMRTERRILLGLAGHAVVLTVPSVLSLFDQAR